MTIRICRIKNLWVLWIFSPLLTQAATYYSQSSSDPTTLSNWNTSRSGGGSAPSNFSTGSDVFIIQNGHTMTNSSSWNLTGISMTLQIESGGSLQANAVVDLTPSSTFQIDNGGTLYHNFTGEEIYDGTEVFGASSTVEIQTRPAATYDITTFGNLIINYSSGGNMRFDAGNTGTIAVNGDFTIKNTSSSGSDEVRCATGSATGVTLDVAGNFTISGGSFDFYSSSGGTGGVINVGGDVSVTAGTWNNAGSNNLTFNFTTDNESSTLELVESVVDNAVDHIDWNVPDGKTVTMTSDWEIGSGEILTIDGQVNFSTFFVFGSGSITVNATGILGIGATDGIDNNSTGGNIHFTLGNRSINTGCSIIYNGTSAQETGDGLNDIGTLTGTLQISNTSGNVTLTDGDDIAFGDGFSMIVDESANLVIGSGENVKKSSGSTASLTVNGTIFIEDGDGFSASSTVGGEAFQGLTSCTFGSSGTINYNRSIAQAVTNQFTYENLTLSNGGTKTAAGNLDIDGDFSVTGTVTFVAGSNQVNLSGSWSVGSSASFTESGSTVVFDGTGSHSITNSGGTETFDDLQFTNTGTYTLGGAVRLNSSHTLTISGACTINTGDNEFDGPSANLTMSNGTFNLESVTATDQLPDFGGTLSLSGGTIELGGSGNQILNGGETYNHLTFSGTGTKTISSATSDINGTVFITESCSLDVSSSSFGSGSTNLTMDGGFFIVDGSGTKPDFGGTYSLTGGTIELTGSTSKTLRSGVTYFDVLISGTDVSNSTSSYTLSDGGSFTVESGAQFTTSNRSFSTSGTATVTINGTFVTGDSDGFSGGASTSFTNTGTFNITLGSSSTINYNASSGSQAISDRDDYANLTLSENATKVFSGTPEVAGTYSISGGAATYPTSLTFNSNSTQPVPGESFGTTTIIFSGGGDKELQGDATINGDITFTSGVLVLGSNNLTIGSSANVSSANSTSYVRASGSGRLKRSVSSGSSLVFPVGQNPYLPVTIEVTSGSGGEFAIGVVDGVNSQPDGSGSAITSNCVLKTWTVETPGNANTCSITLQWNNSDQNTDPGASNSSNSVKMGYGLSSDNSWTNEVSASNASNPSSGIYSHTQTGINLAASSTYQFGIGSGSNPLPVEFLSFTGELLPTHALLQWSTAQEIDNEGFEIERSFTGSHWLTVGTVAGMGNHLEQKDYVFVDNDLPKGSSFAYYRLKQQDYSGSFSYSKVLYLAVNHEQNEETHDINSISIQQTEGRTIRVIDPNHSTVSVIIVFDISGNQLAKTHQENSINLSNFPSGIYIAQIRMGQKYEFVKFYLK